MTSTATSPSRETVRAALESEFGRASRSVTLRHKTQDDEVPTEIDLLFFEPSSEESAAESERFLYIVTCGLASRRLPGPTPHFELLLDVWRPLPVAETELIGRRLAELGTLPFRERFELPVEVVLANVSFPSFEQMTHVALRPFPGLEHLGVQPPVALLEVTPLFLKEAEQVRRLTVAEARWRFAAMDIQPGDPRRIEVDLDAAPSSRDRQGTKSAPSATAGTTDVETTWRALEARSSATGLRPGADAQAVNALIERIGEAEAVLDYFNSLRLHDGAASLGGYELLSAAQVLRTRQRFLEQLHNNEFDGRETPLAARKDRRIEPVWWNAQWIPFASRSSDEWLLIDLSPGYRGIMGQVLEWSGEKGPCAIAHPSFAAWLESCVGDGGR